ncbi:MAG: hypothetical protein ACM3SW_20995 [Actinomycetota bacterium]
MKTLLKCALVFLLPLAGYGADNLPSAPEPRPEVAVVPAKPAIPALGAERRTFDRQTVIELGLVAGSLAGDAVSTGMMLNGPYYEQNVLARPFVRSAAGSAAYFGMSFSAIIYGNHLLRNHPRWKHTLNWSIIALETYATTHNSRI